MANQIKQIRFPNKDYTLETWDKDDWSVNLFEGLGKIKQLSIYALPGTTFKVNQDGNVTGETLVINGTGRFFIDLNDRFINDLRIHRTSYENVDNGIGQHAIIIDIIYEGGKANG